MIRSSGDVRADELEKRIERALGYLKDPDYAPPLDSIKLAIAVLEGGGGEGEGVTPEGRPENF